MYRVLERVRQTRIVQDESGLRVVDGDSKNRKITSNMMDEETHGRDWVTPEP
jgi:hypothetical protein